MSKKPTISTEAQVLLKLLRLALGTEPRRYFGEPVEPFPDSIDWKEVIRLSYEHKVSALAVDGLKSSGYDIYNGLNEQQAKELKTMAEPWFNDVIKTEQSYNYYLQVLTTLCQIFKSNGLTPIILKGYGLSLNYPIPSHRGCGDIDIFLIDKNGNPAADKGDQILRSIAKEHTFKGIAPHHTHFEFKGITVENHHELMDPKWNSPEELMFIEKMKKEISVGINPISNIEIAYEPSPEINIIYLITHLFSHFYNGIADLRQICDYALYTRRCQEYVNWDIVTNSLDGVGLLDFFYGLNSIVKQFLCFQINVNSSVAVNRENITMNLVEDFFNFGKSNHSGIRNFDVYYRNRWHYNYFNHQNWLTLTLKHIVSYLSRYILNYESNKNSEKVG